MIIGIDVSKSKLDVHVNPDGRYFMVNNDDEGHKTLHKRLKEIPGTVDLMVVEPTGGYEKPLLCFLVKQSYPVHLCHPQRVHYFAKANGYIAKTDKIDAKVLSEYGTHHPLNANAEAFLKDIKLKELESRHRTLVQCLAAEKASLDKCLINKEVGKSQKRVINLFKDEISKLKTMLNEMIEKDTEKQEKINHFQTVCGMGPEASRTLVIHLPELGHRDRSSITALVGLAPLNKDSGKKCGYRKIYGGRAQVRAMLYMAVLTASRHNKVIKPYYEKLLARGKSKRMAQIACMRKLLLILNAMARDGTTFDDTGYRQSA